MTRRAGLVVVILVATALAAREATATVPTCSRAQSHLKLLNSAIELRLHLQGSLPEESEWLDVLIREKFIDCDTRNSDPWGHPYVYRKSGNTFDLFTVGPDGRAGTTDDQVKANGWAWRQCGAGCSSGCLPGMRFGW